MATILRVVALAGMARSPDAGTHGPEDGGVVETDTDTEYVEDAMARRSPGPSVKDKALYEELRGEGNSKEKSARIANAAAARGRSSVGRKGGESGSYEDWTVAELRERAAQIGIEGRSRMRKAELIDALRHH